MVETAKDSGVSRGVFVSVARMLLLLMLVEGAHAAFLSGMSNPRKALVKTIGSPAARNRLVGHDNIGTALLSAAEDWNEQLGQVIEKQKRAALVEAIMCPTGGDSLVDTYLVGRDNSLPTSTQNDTLTCLVLSKETSEKQPDKTESPCLILPLSTASSSAQLKLLSFAYAGRPISKSVCLTLNSLLVNRDGDLFDNLPWSSWSVDPQLRNRDAAGNVVNPKFHLGKRDAYNRFMGKDWQGRSVSYGNLALRLKYVLEEARLDEESNKKNQDEESVLDTWHEDSTATLAKRVLELQIREMQMELAEWDYRLAVARTNEHNDLESVERSRQECQDRLTEMQETLASLVQQQQQEDGTDAKDPLYVSILNKIADMSTDEGKNAAPYRGAIGYAPVLDTKDDVEGSLLPYTSPYDLMKEIIGDQLNADVIGAVLENTSLFEGTLALGGAIILRRRTPTKTTTLFGEELSVTDEEEDFGNEGGKGGATILVECDADEAVGMAMSCGIPIRVESLIWERSNLLAGPAPQQEEEEPRNVMDYIPLWETRNRDISFLVEGQGRNESSTQKTSPLRIPRSTASLFESMFESRPPSSSPSPMFPTDNPIQSLTEYDALDNQGKARALLSLSNFNGKLPRPRVLREAEAKKRASSSEKYAQNPLDEMLLPLVDESVRRQYLIRDAEQRQDYDTVKALKESVSKRLVAKEKAERAREVGADDVAEWWEDEAELYGSLRADITQDEGAYSRFLDKDEWYERDRKALAKRNKKSNFGTLLDGIE